ncbi:hypothetical protein ACQ86N_03165 [Puia sp. P3]|uniref:hypothetical protein n=1 Tax=Puia sp. P3 TaxID=3423952 RepID=UPI003D678A91
MPVRKDFLLDQLHEFFDVLQQIAARLMERNLDKAEEKINELWSAETIARLTAEGDDPGLQQEKFSFLRFQTELLMLKIKLEEAKGRDTAQLRQQARVAVNRLIRLRPNDYDLELQQHLQNLSSP